MKGNRNQSKRYGLLMAILVANWAAIAWIVFKVNPESLRDMIFPNSYFPMIVLLFSGLFFLLSILFLSARRALRWSLGMVFFVTLRIHGLGNLLNGILILGILLVIEYYLSVQITKQEKNATISEQVE
jgi:hypothetical protein